MQIYGSNYANVFTCFLHIIRTEGISAFYVSYPATIALNIPFQAIQFPIYEKMRKVLNPSGQYSPLVHIISGGIAGGLSALITTPVDVVKTLLQTKAASQHDRVRNLKGMKDAIRWIYLSSGTNSFAAFWRGWQPRIMSHMPATAICWASYEYFKWLLQ